MADFVKGDTVRLKAGGPLMTIKVESNGIWYCTYFSKRKGEFETQEFLEHQLIKTSKSD